MNTAREYTEDQLRIPFTNIFLNYERALEYFKGYLPGRYDAYLPKVKNPSKQYQGMLAYENRRMQEQRFKLRTYVNYKLANGEIKIATPQQVIDYLGYPIS